MDSTRTTRTLPVTSCHAQVIQPLNRRSGGEKAYRSRGPQALLNVAVGLPNESLLRARGCSCFGSCNQPKVSGLKARKIPPREALRWSFRLFSRVSSRIRKLTRGGQGGVCYWESSSTTTMSTRSPTAKARIGSSRAKSPTTAECWM